MNRSALPFVLGVPDRWRSDQAQLESVIWKEKADRAANSGTTGKQTVTSMMSGIICRIPIARKRR
jgi:hypothetical protein